MNSSKHELPTLDTLSQKMALRQTRKKISVVTSWPVPKTIKQVRSFLGFSGFYRRLLKNYAGIARPLNDLLVGISNKKDKRKRAVPFHWGESPQNASDELKRRLSSAPILAYADIIKNHTKSILLPPPVDLALCFIIRRTMWIVSFLMQVEVCVQVKIPYSQTRGFGTQMGSNRKQVAQRATIAHLSPMCQGRISFQKIQTHLSFNACSCYMKVSKGSNQKQQRKSGNTIFPIIRSIGIFLRRSRAANSLVGGPIWSKFELIHNIMHVLVTSKFEKDRININRDYVMIRFFRRSRAANSVVSGGICPKFKLV